LFLLYIYGYFVTSHCFVQKQCQDISVFQKKESVQKLTIAIVH